MEKVKISGDSWLVKLARMGGINEDRRMNSCTVVRRALIGATAIVGFFSVACGLMLNAVIASMSIMLSVPFFDSVNKLVDMSPFWIGFLLKVLISMGLVFGVILGAILGIITFMFLINILYGAYLICASWIISRFLKGKKPSGATDIIKSYLDKICKPVEIVD